MTEDKHRDEYNAFGLLVTAAPDPTTVPCVCEYCRLVTGGHDAGCITQVATSLPDDTQAERHHLDQWTDAQCGRCSCTDHTCLADCDCCPHPDPCNE